MITVNRQLGYGCGRVQKTGRFSRPTAQLRKTTDLMKFSKFTGLKNTHKSSSMTRPSIYSSSTYSRLQSDFAE